MSRGHRSYFFSLILCLAACGGGAPKAEDASDVSSSPSAAETPKSSPPPEAKGDEPKTTEDEPSSKPKKEEVPEPTFTEDMTVEQAIKAIPASAERLNVDQETMSKPLQDEALYEPCKPGSTHFKLRVAVWRGKAVAIDLTTTPKNPKLSQCLKERIRALTWSAKVPSLNTVDYAM